MRTFLLLTFVINLWAYSGTDIDEKQILALCDRSDVAQVKRTVRTISRSDDLRYVPALVELLLFCPDSKPYVLSCLQSLTGEKWESYLEWIGFIGSHPYPTHDGYRQLRATLMSAIDPHLARFFANDYPSSIRLEEIVWGGVAKDGIPALMMPKFISASTADYLLDDERVFGLVINGVARAYPQRIMDWHEMVNDVVAETPVSIAYCTLCRAAIAYEGSTGSGIYTFSTSGLLYRSNKLMYDHQTETLWNQFSGEPVFGKLQGRDIRLKVMPLLFTTWADWLKTYPDSQVLDMETGYERRYEPGAAYKAYFSSPKLMYPVWNATDDAGMKKKDVLWIVRLAKASKAYALKRLIQNPLLVDELDGQRILIVTDGVPITVRGYFLAENQLEDREGELLIVDPDRNGIAFSRSQPVGANGAPLKLVPSHLAYYFAYQSLMPGVPIFR